MIDYSDYLLQQQIDEGDFGGAGGGSGFVTGSGIFTGHSGTQIIHNVGTLEHYTLVTPAGTQDYDVDTIASLGAIYIDVGENIDIVYNTGGDSTVSGIWFHWGVTASGVVGDGGSTENSQEILAGLQASRPDATTSGRLYLPTDGYTPSIDTGNEWKPYIMDVGFLGSNPPAASGIIAINHGAYISLVQDGDGLLFTQLGDANGSNYAAASVVAVPGSPPYALTVGLDILSLIPNTNGGFIGLCVTDGVESDSYVYCCYIFLAGNPYMFQTYGQKWRFPGTWMATPLNPGTTTNMAPFLSNGRVYMRLTDDGTNLVFQLSRDCKHWDLFPYDLSVGRTAQVTPAYIGLFTGHGGMSVATSLTRMRARIFHWSLD